MRAIDILDSQVELIKWWQTPFAKIYADKFFEHTFEQNLNSKGDIAMITAGHLNRASSYYVSADMCDMIFALTRDENLPVTNYGPEDLPSKDGFVVFEKPIYGPDKHGNLMQIRAYQWWWTEERLTLLSYADHAYENSLPEPIDEYQRQGIEGGHDVMGMVRRGLFHHQFSCVDMKIVHWDIMPKALAFMKDPEEALPAEMTKAIQKARDTGFSMPEPYIIQGASGKQYTLEDYSAFSGHRMLRAFGLIAKQRVAGRVGHLPDRAQRRRMEGLSFPPEVIEILLRREVKKPTREGMDDDVPVQWSHRWLVEGHWRWQYYPSTDGHDWVYVSGYVKGPDDLPLVVKDKIFKVIR